MPPLAVLSVVSWTTTNAIVVVSLTEAIRRETSVGGQLAASSVVNWST